MIDQMVTIDEVADIYDGPHATPRKTNSGPYFLSISSLEKGRLDLSKSAFLSEDDYKKWTRRVTPQKGDLLFSYETRLGEAALMPDNLRACLGRRMGLLRPKPDKVIPEYLLYAYLSPDFQRTIVGKTIRGATVDRIALNDLPKFKIRIPDLEEQRQVAGLLKALDSRIELNNGINVELEALTKAIYNFWFVQFDFPSNQSAAYRSSGGAMTYNSDYANELPTGWDVAAMGDVIGLQKGISYTSQEIESTDGIPMINLGSIDKNRQYRDDKIKYFSGSPGQDKIIIPGDMLLACTDLTREGVIIGCPIFVPAHHEKFTFSMDLAKVNIVSDKVLPTYIYMSLRTSWYHEYIKKFASGTNVQHLDTKGVTRYKVALPPLELQCEFERMTRPMFDRLSQSLVENQELARLRDWLLPMLMNGQVVLNTKVDANLTTASAYKQHELSLFAAGE